MPAILIIPPILTAATIQQSLRVRPRPVIQFGLITAPAYHLSHEGKMVFSEADHPEEMLELVRVKKMERKG